MRIPRRATVYFLNSSLHSSKPSRRLPALSRLLQHGLKGRARSLISQLHVSSGEPDLVAASPWFTSRFETKLVLLDAPFADALVTHGCDCECAVTLEHLAPVSFIRQFHAGESCLNLRARELLELLLSRGIRFEPNYTQRRDHRRSHLLLRLHRGRPDATHSQ